MKRFYTYFFSLFLLSIAGITSVAAQGFMQGDLLTSMDDIVGKQVLIFANGGVTSDAPAGYLHGSGPLTAEPNTKNHLFTFEATGKTTANGGHAIYRLKQVATNLYLKDFLLSPDDEENSVVAWVADVNQAYEFTSLEAVPLEGIVGDDGNITYNVTDDEESVRTQATPKKQNLDETSFIFARAELTPTGEGTFYRTFLGHIGSPFCSPYVDTNAWNIFAVENLTGKDKLQSYADAYYQNQPTDEFPIGTSPGTYNEELVNAAQAVYDQVQTQLNESFTLSDAEVDALCEQIEKTYEAAKNSLKGIEDGTYFIHDSRATQCFLYGQKSGSNYVVSAKSGYSIPDPYDTTVPQYVWQVTTVGKDTILLKNIVADLYFQASSKALSGHYDLGAIGAKLVVSQPTAGNLSSFWLSPAGTAERICSNPDGRVLNWTDVNDSGNHWVFEPVDASVLADLIEKAKQDVLNNNLKSAVTTAKNAYNAGVYMSEVAGGVDFTAEGALVVATGDENASNWWSNRKESSEGSYEALVDNNFATYFHSSWSSNHATPENPHFLVANLSEAVSGLIEIKMAVRDHHTNENFPSLITVYGANEFDVENPDATEWVQQGDQIPVTWNLTAEEGFEFKTTNNVGYAIATLDGSYKYIRFDVNMCKQGNNKNFAISECNIWPAVGSELIYTPEFQEVQKTNPAIITNLLAEIEKSEAMVKAGNATQEQIDAMNEAYQTFLDNYPDPTRVTTALNNAKTILAAANDENNPLVGEELAQYPQEAADALQAVIDNYEDFSSVSLTEINAAVKAINDAVAQFQTTVRLPEAGKFYTLRSASKKQGGGQSGSGYDGVLYRALIYSSGNVIDPKNGTARQNTGALNFYRLDGSSDVAEDADESVYEALQDSVSVSDDVRTIWKAEKAENGKIVLRNVGTGMYLAPQNGWIKQSIEPFAIPVEGVAAKTFVFNTGQDEEGTTWYMNTMGAYSRVVAWKARDDENSKWFIEELSADEVSNATLFMQNGVKADQYYVGTFPYAISAGDGDLDAAYKVLGISENDGERKLVLAQYEDQIPAATPFIYKFLMTSHNGDSENGVGMAQLSIATDDMAQFSDYVFTPATANGLVGTICERDTIAAGTAYFNNGELVDVKGSATQVIGTNSGYLVECGVTTEEGDATIDLGEFLTGINDSKVVVLPSTVDVYSLNGTLVRKGVKSVDATKNLPAGIYVVGGVKVLVK